MAMRPTKAEYARRDDAVRVSRNALRELEAGALTRIGDGQYYQCNNARGIVPRKWFNELLDSGCIVRDDGVLTAWQREQGIAGFAVTAKGSQKLVELMRENGSSGADACPVMAGGGA